MDTSQYYIQQKFTKLTPQTRQSFLRLIQELHRLYPFLFSNNGGSINFISNYRGDEIDMNNLWVLSSLFLNRVSFDEFYKIFNKKMGVKITINKELKELLIKNEKLDEFKKTIKGVVLFNMIRNKIAKKTMKNINDYRLFDNLKGIYINLEQILNKPTDEYLKDYMTNIYNYTNSLTFLNVLSDENYDTVYKVIDNFE